VKAVQVGRKGICSRIEWDNSRNRWDLRRSSFSHYKVITLYVATHGNNCREKLKNYFEFGISIAFGSKID
jgi:hypothetical protein